MNTAGTQERFTIEALEAAVEETLAATPYAGATNGKVRAVPDQRTLRYYTTLGLLDRPAEMRGRTAYYGRRHVLQVVAIKRLQAQGLTLGDIQARLAGQSDAALEALAQLPAALVLPNQTEGEAASPSRRDGAFWTAVPAAEIRKTAHPLPPARVVAPEEPDLLGVALAEGAHLLFRPNRPLEAGEAEALRTAAAPLLALLASRGLWTAGRPKGDD